MKITFRILTGLVLVFSTSDSQLIPTSSEYYYAIIAVHRDLTHNIMLNPFLEVHGFIFKTSPYFLPEFRISRNYSPNPTCSARINKNVQFREYILRMIKSSENSINWPIFQVIR